MLIAAFCYSRDSDILFLPPQAILYYAVSPFLQQLFLGQETFIDLDVVVLVDERNQLQRHAFTFRS
jgi:hypothetical protein